MKKITLLTFLYVGVAALSKAAIVYTDVNPNVTVNSGTHSIDLDNNGSNDFDLDNWSDISIPDAYCEVTIAQNTFGVVGTYSAANFQGYSDVLSSGTPIGSSSAFINYTQSQWMGIAYINGSPNDYTSWLGQNNQYLGVKFQISGATHYGWIEISFTTNYDLIVHGYAYETVANQTIAAGNTGGTTGCIDPSNLTATNITSTSANLVWTENGTATIWDIEHGASGFSPSGTPNVTGIATNPYSLNSLLANTPYDFYVRADCGGTSGTSSWVGPFTFTTTCIVGSITNSSPTLTANPAGASYRWLDCNNGNAIIAGETNSTFTATVNGNYAVEITLNNCVDTSNCESITNVSVQEVSKNTFNIYPNPVRENLMISSAEKLNNITICAVNGQVITTIANPTENARLPAGTEVNVSNLIKGMYIIKVQTSKGVSQMKFIKE